MMMTLLRQFKPYQQNICPDLYTIDGSNQNGCVHIYYLFTLSILKHSHRNFVSVCRANPFLTIHNLYEFHMEQPLRFSVIRSLFACLTLYPSLSVALVYALIFKNISNIEFQTKIYINIRWNNHLKLQCNVCLDWISIKHA